MKKNLTKISPKLKKRPELPKALPRAEALPRAKALSRKTRAGGRRLLRRGKRPEEKISEALKSVPRITSDTVEEHREEVLSSARKYIYPLQHSKRHVVRNSILILLLVVIVFFVSCGLALYKFQSTGGFIYGVTKVVPFPVAKVGSHYVSYESYLFELRRNMHYYHTQQHADFSTADGRQQLKRLKQQALAAAIQGTYVNELAKQHGVTVSKAAVNDEVNLLRQQNRLGSSDRVLREVLNEFWGWSENDFKRELHQQLLQQAVVAKLDTATNRRAQAALNQLEQGADFSKLAAKVSDDAATKASGGQYSAPITANDRSLPPALTAQITKLKPGQVSGVINTGYALEIVKVTDTKKGTIRAAHIQFRFKPVSDYTKQLQRQQPVHKFIKV